MTTLDKFVTIGNFENSLPQKKFIDLISTPQQEHAFALDESSYLWSWGYNTYGQLGDNTTTHRFSPVSVVGGRQFRKIAIGNYKIFALDASSYLWGWGNTYVGDNTIAARSSPTSVVGGRQFIDITIVNGIPFALDASSYLWSWGPNNNGVLGDNTITNRSSPVSVVGGRRWRKFPKLDADHPSVFLDESSYAWGWGSGSAGKLGTNTILNRSSPTSVVGGRQWLAIAADRNTQGAHLFDASSFLWGFGAGSNYIGDGTTLNRSSPVSVLTSTKFLKVTSYQTINFAVDTSSQIWYWGSGGPVTSPSRYSDVTQIFKPASLKVSNEPAGIWATGIDTNGDIYSWGPNSVGQHGNNSATAVITSSPNKAIARTKFIINAPIVNIVSAGGATYVALNESSNIWTWGGGNSGITYAKGDTLNRSVPSVMPSIIYKTNVLGN